MSEADPAKAANTFRRILLKEPRRLDALVGLGCELRRLGKADEAETYLKKALRVRADEPTALRTLGGLLQLQGRYGEAIAIADAALAVRPDCAEAWLTRGDSLANSGRQDLAVEAYARTLGDPNIGFDALLRLGKMHRVLGRTDEARAALDQALRLDPDSALPVYERALMELETGNFAAGWRDYEARWRSERYADTWGYVPREMIPALKTAPSSLDLAGKRVLLMGEQGIGDQVMFASQIPDLARVAASVVCVCEPRLIRLFAASFPGVTFLDPKTAQVDGDAVDLLMAMGSLGSAFRQSGDDFPGTAFLRPREPVRARWAERLGAPRRRMRVGLSWRGGTPQTGRQNRSIPLADLAPILDLPDCEFVSLQYGDVGEEIAAVNAGRADPIQAFAPDDFSDFEEMAGLIDGLDGVVSVQNAAVHLSGAIGKRCLTLVPHNPEWRYLRSGERMPWYGSVRLLRQTTPGDWGPVVAQAAAALGA
jgi:Flp pilus assembly protein TadD